MRNRFQLILATTIAASIAITTLANASESSHQWSLEAGFEPDPKFVEVAAGGPTEGDCGHLPDEPQLVVQYESGPFVLSIGTIAAVDSTLEVRTPTGNILCDDDSGGDGDALIVLDDPESGQYEIRVGTYSSDGIGRNVNLFVSETLDEPPSDEDHQWSLEAGFQPDPRSVEVAAGGPIEGDCGHLPDEPQLVVHYESGRFDLTIATIADVDSTLEVRTPAGNILCDDDSFGDGDALIVLESPESGRYEVRVGTFFSDGIGRSATLFLTEDVPDPPQVSSGTGFLVTDTHIVTNWHVIDGAIGSVTVRALGLPEFEAEVVAHNEEADIALLYTEDKPRSLGAVVFRAYPPVSIGESVVVFGFPMRGGNLTHGEVSALTGEDGDLTELQFTAPIQPGSSGSPLFDEKGHVVGMVTSTKTDTQLVNFAVRGTLIRIFLDSNNVAYIFSDSDGSSSSTDRNATPQNVVVELIVNAS